MPGRRDSHETITVYVSAEGLALLREHNFPCSDGVLATATVTEHSIRLTGMRFEIESLAGQVAGEALTPPSIHRAWARPERSERIHLMVLDGRNLI